MWIAWNELRHYHLPHHQIRLHIILNHKIDNKIPIYTHIKRLLSNQMMHLNTDTIGS